MRALYTSDDKGRVVKDITTNFKIFTECRGSSVAHVAVK